MLYIRPGQSVVYHTGFLTKDREQGFSNLPRDERIKLHALAAELLEASDRGEGFLTQKKVGDNLYAYIYTARANSKETA